MRFVLLFNLLMWICTAPIAASFDTKLAKAIQQGEHQGVSSFIQLQHGEVTHEAYAPDVNANELHDLRSVTKSIFSLLVGAAISQGHIADTSMSVSQLSHGTSYQGSVRHALNLQALMTMRSGLACDDWVPASLGFEDKMYQQQDWASFVLALPLSHETGQHFSYCTGNPIVVGHMLAQRLDQPFQQWANESLFAPLDIDQYQWAMTPNGKVDTGGHLHLKSIDLARIGQLIVDKGRVEDRQLIDADWITISTSEHTKVYERRQTYGYWWWRDSVDTKQGKVDVVFAWGNGGNFVFIVPEQQRVLVFTGNNYNSRAGLQPLKWMKQLVSGSH